MSFVNGETSHHAASRNWTDMAVTLPIVLLALLESLVTGSAAFSGPNSR